MTRNLATIAVAALGFCSQADAAWLPVARQGGDQTRPDGEGLAEECDWSKLTVQVQQQPSAFEFGSDPEIDRGVLKSASTRVNFADHSMLVVLTGTVLSVELAQEAVGAKGELSVELSLDSGSLDDADAPSNSQKAHESRVLRLSRENSRRLEQVERRGLLRLSASCSVGGVSAGERQFFIEARSWAASWRYALDSLILYESRLDSATHAGWASHYVLAARVSTGNRSGFARFWRFLDPGLGFHTALVDYDKVSAGPELGVGVTVALFGEAVVLGYGINTGTAAKKQEYIFLGTSLGRLVQLVKAHAPDK